MSDDGKALRDWMDEKFSDLHKRLDAMKDDYHNKSIEAIEKVARLEAVAAAHADKLEKLENKAWHAVVAIITALISVIWHTVTFIFGSWKH